MDESCEFSLDENFVKMMKFPCGMGTNIVVHFNPTADKDFYHKLIIVSNHSRLTVPIIGKNAIYKQRQKIEHRNSQLTNVHLLKASVPEDF